MLLIKENKIVESFGGSLNLILWIIGWAGTIYYAYRCLFAIEGMMEQYGFGDQSAFVITLLGTFVAAGFMFGMVLLFSGPHGAWAFVTYIFLQSVLGVIFGYKILNSSWADIEGIKPSVEGWIEPLIFATIYGFLLFNMQDILYKIVRATTLWTIFHWLGNQPSCANIF